MSVMRSLALLFSDYSTEVVGEQAARGRPGRVMGFLACVEKLEETVSGYS
jgi:hypothetical protein